MVWLQTQQASRKKAAMLACVSNNPLILKSTSWNWCLDKIYIPDKSCFLLPYPSFLITWKIRTIFQNIWGRVVGNILINISYSNIFPSIIFPDTDTFHQYCQAVFAAVSTNSCPAMWPMGLTCPWNQKVLRINVLWQNMVALP